LYTSAQEELQDAEARLKRQDEQIQLLRDDADKAQTLQRELDAVTQQRQNAENVIAKKNETHSKSQNEIKELESEVVRLTTDLALARAEVDAAYGSRSQRQADWAAAANTEATAKLEEATKRNAELEQQMATLQSERASQREEALKKELSETLADFEDLTKASVEAEKERDALELTVDKLREQIENLESQLSDERVKLMGIKSPGGADGTQPQQSTGAVVLKNEFKKMMRDTRAEHLKAMRVRYGLRLRIMQIETSRC
jgi:chromosome segregation ATPase